VEDREGGNVPLSSNESRLRFVAWTTKLIICVAPASFRDDRRSPPKEEVHYSVLVLPP